jgi:hypothetical protein
MRHFGTARDTVKDGPFGCKTRAGQQSAAECLEAYPGSEVGRWQLQQREQVYARWVTRRRHHHAHAADVASCIMNATNGSRMPGRLRAAADVLVNYKH